VPQEEPPPQARRGAGRHLQDPAHRLDDPPAQHEADRWAAAGRGLTEGARGGGRGGVGGSHAPCNSPLPPPCTGAAPFFALEADERNKFYKTHKLRPISETVFSILEEVVSTSAAYTPHATLAMGAAHEHYQRVGAGTRVGVGGRGLARRAAGRARSPPPRPLPTPQRGAATTATATAPKTPTTTAQTTPMTTLLPRAAAGAAAPAAAAAAAAAKKPATGTATASRTMRRQAAAAAWAK
jgi:hypothetical protein